MGRVGRWHFTPTKIGEFLDGLQLSKHLMEQSSPLFPSGLQLPTGPSLGYCAMGARWATTQAEYILSWAKIGSKAKTCLETQFDWPCWVATTVSHF